MPLPFEGRSLMSAEWTLKPRAGGGRRGHNRYATKSLTPGSWTATEDPRLPVGGNGGGDPSVFSAGAGTRVTGSVASREVAGDGRVGSGNNILLGSVTEYWSKQLAGGGDGARGRLKGSGVVVADVNGPKQRRGARARAGAGSSKRGLGRGWEGLYQIRSFDDTPE